MIRAQCIVQRGSHILMAKHRLNGEEWWCLPGGRVQEGESGAEAALRELQEECCVVGRLIRQTSQAVEDGGTQAITFFVDIGHQEPRIGSDPEFTHADQILVDLRWLTLAEIPERDRAYLWAAGLLSLPEFLEEVSAWGDPLSYPGR